MAVTVVIFPYDARDVVHIECDNIGNKYYDIINRIILYYCMS